MAGVGSEPTISACPRSEARRSHGKDADASKASPHRISEPYECGAMSS